jgi:hypothetical protein
MVSWRLGGTWAEELGGHDAMGLETGLPAGRSLNCLCYGSLVLLGFSTTAGQMLIRAGTSSLYSARRTSACHLVPGYLALQFCEVVSNQQVVRDGQ